MSSAVSSEPSWNLTPGPQLDLPGERIGRASTTRDTRASRAPRSSMRTSAIEDVHLRREIGLRRDEVRIQRRHVGGQADAQLGGVTRRHDEPTSDAERSLHENAAALIAEARLTRSRWSLRPKLVSERALVGARRVHDAFARRPEVFLMVKRDDADIASSRLPSPAAGASRAAHRRRSRAPDRAARPS